MHRYRTLTEHLDPEGATKRILALDGGGLRGMLTLGMLREVESILRERRDGDPAFRLCDYFDLIAGTSTGAIIAAALALGMTVDEVDAHYRNLGRVVFKRSLLRWGALRAKYPAEKVQEALVSVYGDRLLGSPDLRTGLLVVSKRLDTGSTWPLTNHPNSKYFERGAQAKTIANREYPLWQVVRASTAAPYFFDPESIRIGSGGDDAKPVDGDFVDGGVSPHNNPALQALMTATMPGYRFGWASGEDRLLVVSLGTGKANAEVGHANLLTGTAAIHAVLSLKALMEDCGDQVETIMQWLSRSPTAREIDREIGKVDAPLGGIPLCSYLRYNVHLTSEWVEKHLGESINSEAMKALEAMDEPDNMEELSRLGQLAGRKLVEQSHFSKNFDVL